ncbi:methyltransferase [Lentzea sp. NPDC059081]|uniref:methyltransferase n=1 Tax=Lentzea sp. NPDC059081 TaxID=3346719 RepID=UPI0036883BC8
MVDGYDFGRHSRVLCVGDGSATYSISLCRRHPKLNVTVANLPEPPVVAGMEVRRAGLAGRITVLSQDFFATLPSGHDLVLVPSILQGWNSRQNRALLASCLAALPPGGTVAVAELVPDDERGAPLTAALLGMAMTVHTEHGGSHREGEIRRWLEELGFAGVRTTWLAAPGANVLLVATKPRDTSADLSPS